MKAKKGPVIATGGKRSHKKTAEKLHSPRLFSGVTWIVASVHLTSVER